MNTVDETKQKCFIVSAIGQPASQTRLRADEVLEFIIEPACKECNYDAIRADSISEPGIITADMINHLIEAPLVIADLTERNPNVYYEVGIRHSFNKPIILISEEIDIPFDLHALRVITFNHTNLRAANQCIRQIVEQIKAIEADPNKLANPISQYATLQTFERSDKPIERAVFDIQNQISTINYQLRKMDSFSDNGKVNQFFSSLEPVITSLRKFIIKEMREAEKEMAKENFSVDEMSNARMRYVMLKGMDINLGNTYRELFGVDDKNDVISIRTG